MKYDETWMKSTYETVKLNAYWCLVKQLGAHRKHYTWTLAHNVYDCHWRISLFDIDLTKLERCKMCGTRIPKATRNAVRLKMLTDKIQM